MTQDDLYSQVMDKLGASGLCSRLERRFAENNWRWGGFPRPYLPTALHIRVELLRQLRIVIAGAMLPFGGGKSISSGRLTTFIDPAFKYIETGITNYDQEDHQCSIKQPGYYLKFLIDQVSNRVTIENDVVCEND